MPSPADRDAVIAHLDELLDSAAFEDYGPNGLQVPGAAQITRVVTAVSATRAVHQRAVELGAELVLVHHGLFWPSLGPLDAVSAGRLRPLLTAEINLAAYHLPLDAHPQVGNNALLADALELTARQRFAVHRGHALGIAGTLPGDGLTPDALAARLGELCRPPLHLPGGPERIRTVGIVSGGAADDAHAAAALGLDAFVTGEPEERSQADVAELGIHLFAAGHHATERFGVRRLGELLAERFGIAHEFVDSGNPV